MTSPRFEQAPGPHGPLGFAIALFVFGLAGLIVLAAAGLAGLLPGWLPQAEGPGGTLVRLFTGALGVSLLAIAFGFLRFRRWAWWGALAWAVWSAVEVVRALDPAALVSGIPFPQLLAALALPYLWARRKDFGVPRRRDRGPRGRLSTTGLH